MPCRRLWSSVPDQGISKKVEIKRYPDSAIMPPGKKLMTRQGHGRAVGRPEAERDLIHESHASRAPRTRPQALRLRGGAGRRHRLSAPDSHRTAADCHPPTARLPGLPSPTPGWRPDRRCLPAGL